MLFPEDLFNQSPSFGALVIQEETPSPLPVGCPTNGLPDLTRHHCVIKLWATISFSSFLPEVALSSLAAPFRLSVPHQARVETPLLEVQWPRDPGKDIFGSADAQSLCKDDVGKYKRSLGV